MGAIPGGIGAVKSLEDVREMLDRDLGPRSGRLDADGDLPAWRRVAQSVGEQLGQHLRNALRVGVEVRRVAVELADQIDALGVVIGSGGGDRGRRDVAGADGLKVK